tara:strand:+ start:123 stop:1133 length:1011 start_codon:yes stop_codon:yes gene_type:complete
MKIGIRNKDSILIAGSNGMVGSSIHRYLKKNFCNTNLEILCPSRKELNYLNKSSVFNWFQKKRPSLVIIAAAKVGGIIANYKYPTSFLLENLNIQNNILEAAFKYSVRRLIFLGSSCIYPKYAVQPIKEEFLLTGSLENTNESYAIAKIAGIKLCESLRREFGFDAISLMPTNLYGPGDNYSLESSHVLPALIRKFDIATKDNLSYVECFGSGKPLREFLYVDDLAEACIFVLNNWIPTKENTPIQENGEPLHILNVGSDEEITIKSLAKRIAKLFKFEGEIIWDTSKPDGTPRKKLDSSRLNNLGWYPKTNLDLGLVKTIENYNNLISCGLLRKE